MLTYSIIVFVILLIAELLYFKIADRFNIIDKPNERSSHTKVVLRGGGVIFLIGVWVWSLAPLFPGVSESMHYVSFQYPWFILAVSIVAGVSFVDDVRSLPDKVRLFAQFVAMVMMFYELDMLYYNQWWIIMLALVVYVGAVNIYNFMDGINGITGGYSLVVLIPLVLINTKFNFIDHSLLVVVGLSLVVFCLFNFRQKNKARCFAGDVGSVGIAFSLMFIIGNLIMQTADMTWLSLLVVYGVDGCLTIIHRIMLHENLGEAHRKHAYQLMANELKMTHISVSSIYMGLQLLISLVMIYIIPDTISAHWYYFVSVIILLSIGYLLFMKKYYHLHEEYLKTRIDQDK